MGLGLAAAGLAARQLTGSPSIPKGQSEKLLVDNPDQPEPAPKGYDRLPLEWYKNTVSRLKTRVIAERHRCNSTRKRPQQGLFQRGASEAAGERSTWVLFPVTEKDTAYWYSPGIDRDLITSWWCTENEYYFCYPHAEGGFPNKGQVIKGNRVDLFEWLLKGLAKRGFSNKTIGTDMKFYPDQLEIIRRVLPDARFVYIGDVCLKMRMIKTQEELALTQRAYRYFDSVHAFARDYILERGTDATDFEIGQALQAYGIN